MPLHIVGWSPPLVWLTPCLFGWQSCYPCIRASPVHGVSIHFIILETWKTWKTLTLWNGLVQLFSVLRGPTGALIWFQILAWFGNPSLSKLFVYCAHIERKKKKVSIYNQFEFCLSVAMIKFLESRSLYFKQGLIEQGVWNLLSLNKQCCASLPVSSNSRVIFQLLQQAGAILGNFRTAWFSFSLLFMKITHFEIFNFEKIVILHLKNAKNLKFFLILLKSWIWQGGLIWSMIFSVSSTHMLASIGEWSMSSVQYWVQ